MANVRVDENPNIQTELRKGLYGKADWFQAYMILAERQQRSLGVDEFGLRNERTWYV
jgi:hypothetical protein